MPESIWLCMAALAALLGMSWLALSLDIHWRQVSAEKNIRRMETPGPSLRLAGAVSLAASLTFCLIADHASMAVLVWIMLIAASAAAVSMTLTWQPLCLRLLTLPWAKNR